MTQVQLGNSIFFSSDSLQIKPVISHSGVSGGKVNGEVGKRAVSRFPVLCEACVHLPYK